MSCWLYEVLVYVLFINRAVSTERHQIVSHIFIMHQKDTYENLAYLLFDNDPCSVQDFAGAPIYTAARIGNPKLLQSLIARSGISLNTILGQRQKQIMPRPDGPDWEHHITPLSLILFMPKSCELIDVLNHNGSASSQHLTSTDLSKTMLTSLPAEIFMLSYLSTLNISHNEISELPFSKLPTDCYPNLLQELNVSHNNIQHIPSELFNLPCLRTLNVSNNPLKSLPKDWWTTKSIVTLNLSHTHLENLSINENDKSAVQPEYSSISLRHSVIHGQYSVQSWAAIPVRTKSDYRLQNLNFSYCCIKKFPGLLAYYVPNLEILNLSNNKLQSCCAINQLPISLVELDLSNNDLSNYHEHKLFYRDIEIQSSSMRHSELSKLKYLKLANNINLRTLTVHDEHKSGGDASTTCIFFPKLVRLNISNCGLIKPPQFLSGLQQLTDLDISSNKDLSIPHEICDLKHLINFNYDKVKDPIANTLNTFTLTREKRMFLNPHQ